MSWTATVRWLTWGMTLKDALKSSLLGWTAPVQSGPLKGFRWVKVSGSKFVRGTYEVDSTAVFLSHIRPGAVVFDIGAHVGYYSALACHLAGTTGRVFAFEPRPFNLRCLKRHRVLNHLDQLQVFDVCVGASAGTARFESRTGSGTGHLAPDGDLAVSVISLDDWHRQGRLPRPDFIKVDVEGAERDVLEGGRGLLAAAKPKLLLSIHSLELNTWVQQFLRGLGYEMTFVKGNPTSVDPEIFAAPIAA